MHAIVPLMSTASTWSTDSSVMSRHDICSRATSPTLLITTSTVPSSANTSSANAATASHDAMSAWNSTASAPRARTCLAVSSAPKRDER